MFHRFNHPSLFVGDFNSHHSAWGYGHDDENGIVLLEWMEVNNFQLFFNAKDKGTFRSARWRREYSPDLCFISKGPFGNDHVPASRFVLDDFPHSQHRPVLIDYGLKVDLVDSIPISRWNFRLAKWDHFRSEMENLFDGKQLRPVPENYDVFAGMIIMATKKSIPRGLRREYVPN